MSEFIYGNQKELHGIHRGEVPAGIQSEAVLMEALFDALRFPDYFGSNWDALWECICDLSWLPPGDVVLRHKDLPLTEDRGSLLTYLTILQNAVQNWNSKGSNLIFASPEERDTSGEREALVNRRFFVVFPPGTKDTVETLLAKACESNGSS